jgi:hypothetical protein
VLKCKNGLFSVVTLTTEFQTAFESNISTRTVCRELNDMGFHGRDAEHNPRSPFTMPSIGWSGVKLAAIGLWSSGNVFSGVV